MSKQEHSYVITIRSGNHGSSFVASELRLGLDEGLRRLDNVTPGVAKAIGQHFRALVEGSKELAEGSSMDFAGKCERGSGSMSVIKLPRI